MNTLSSLRKQGSSFSSINHGSPLEFIPPRRNKKKKLTTLVMATASFFTNGFLPVQTIEYLDNELEPLVREKLDQKTPKPAVDASNRSVV